MWMTRREREQSLLASGKGGKGEREANIKALENFQPQQLIEDDFENLNRIGAREIQISFALWFLFTQCNINSRPLDKTSEQMTKLVRGENASCKMVK